MSQKTVGTLTIPHDDTPATIIAGFLDMLRALGYAVAVKRQADATVYTLTVAEDG